MSEMEENQSQAGNRRLSMAASESLKPVEAGTDQDELAISRTVTLEREGSTAISANKVDESKSKLDLHS
jgi:hypothetical protein